MKPLPFKRYALWCVCAALTTLSTGCLSDEGARSGDASDTNTADTAAADTSPADTALPDTHTPDSASPDTSAPDSVAPPDTGSGSDTVSEPGDVVEPDTTLPPERGPITSNQGEQTRPGAVVQLGVELDDEQEQEITSFRWSVEQPAGSRSWFVPDEFARAPTFEAWVVGTYVFHLDVVINQSEYRRIGSYQMLVLPTDAVHIELTWRTPGDPDETDTGGNASSSAGSDVDLHVLQPTAQGKYFDFTYDCYWENTNPEWGVSGPADNPSIDRDDTDGAGPEVTSIDSMEAVAYRVGVHYWNDWGYGEAFATVRIYIGGVLRDEWEVEVVNGDMWESHTIDGATGTVTRLTGTDGQTALITPEYPISPGFPF